MFRLTGFIVHDLVQDPDGSCRHVRRLGRPQGRLLASLYVGREDDVEMRAVFAAWLPSARMSTLAQWTVFSRLTGRQG